MSTPQEWYEKDYYKVLGVSKDATDKDIQKAYRKLARQYHPDKNPGDAKAEERFKDISAAYDVVGDDTKRPDYDEAQRLGATGGFGRSGGGGFGGGGPSGFGGQGGGLGDILGDLFGGGSGGRQRGQQQQHGPRKGADLEAQLHLSFEDAVHGVTTSVHLTSDAPCSTCSGSGAKPGTTPQTCGSCHGRGVLDDNQGLFSFSQPCVPCGGRGKIIKDKCGTCHGSGVERRPRQVAVRVPAGVKDGQKIRLKGRGTPGRNGGPAGDLFVNVIVAAHRFFARSGNNLTINVPVSYAEAVLGSKVKVPLLDSGSVTLKIPGGTQNGKTFRVTGKGIAGKKGKGDLLVTIDVVVPVTVNDEQRAAVEALAATMPASPRAHLEVTSDGST